MSNPTDRRLAPQAPDFADMLAKGGAEIEGYRARIAELESICGNLRSRAEAAEECIVHQAKGSAEDERRIDYFTEGRDAARAEVVELRELLRRLEWDDGCICEICGGWNGPDEGHATDCELAAALAHDHAQTTTEPEQPPPIQAD